MRSFRLMACAYSALACCSLAFAAAGDVLAQVDQPALTVRVVDAEQEPVAGAQVILFSTDSKSIAHYAATTDSDGEFQIDVQEATRGSYALIAWKKGFGLGHVPREALDAWIGKNASVPKTLDVDIELPPAQTVTFKVVDPAGTAVANTIVKARSMSGPDGQPMFYGGGSTELNILHRRTDQSGVVTIDYLPSGTVGGLAIETEEHGLQLAVVSANQTEKDLTLRLQPASRLKLKLSADDSADLQHRKISVNVRLASNPDTSLNEPLLRVAWSNPTLVTNENGVAEATVMAGKATVYIAPSPDDTSFPDTSSLQGISLVPGKTAEYSIQFKPGVKLHGKVLDTQGKPVAGVEVLVGNKTLISNNDGTYATIVSATGRVFSRTLSVPACYTMPFSIYVNQAAAAENQREVEQPDIIVGLAADLGGSVVDAQGKLFAEAVVDASWQASDPQGQSFTIKSDQTTTDSQGKFTFLHVLKGADVRLTAKSETQTSVTKLLNTTEPQQVELKISPDGMINIIGTVAGSDGTLIGNAEIGVSRSLLDAGGHSYGQRPVKVNGQDEFAAEPTGEFKTPQKLPRYEQYSLKIEAPGYLSEQTDFLSAGNSGDLSIGEILLVPVRRFSGRIIDSAGKPVAGATVSAYSSQTKDGRKLEKVSTTSDAEGEFKLAQLHPRAALASVKKDGYRMSGMSLLPSATERLILFRSEETIPHEHRVTASDLKTTARREAAELMLATLLERRRDSNYFYTELLKMQLRVDRDAALLELENAKSASARASVLAELGEVGDAISEAATLSDPYARCRAMLAVAKKSDDREFWLDALATVLVEAEQISRPDRRLMTIRNVADAFYDKGEQAYANTITTDHMTLAEAMSRSEWPGFARGSFAESLAHYDLQAAEKMLGEADEDDRARHYRNTAHRLAAINPEAAEQLIKQLGRTNYIDSPIVRVVYRMAKVDLPRALGLLEDLDEGIQSASKARGLGVIAVAIMDRDPAKATELLQKAFDAIPVRPTGLSSWPDQSFGAALALLRYAEQVDPENLTDYFWQAVGNYGGPRGNAWSPEDEEEENTERQAQLAILLALYNQPTELVQHVAEPVFEFWEQQLDAKESNSRFTDNQAAFIAMTLADPQRAADWATAFDSSLKKETQRYIPQPWEVVGNALTKDREALGKQLTKEVYHSWVIDEYDF